MKISREEARRHIRGTLELRRRMEPQNVDAAMRRAMRLGDEALMMALDALAPKPSVWSSVARAIGDLLSWSRKPSSIFSR